MRKTLSLGFFASMLVFVSPVAAGGQPAGSWSDIDGEYSIDFAQKVYYGIDDSCQIISITRHNDKYFELKLKCRSESKKTQEVGAELTKLKQGWRLKFDASYGSWKVDLVQKEAN